MVGVGGASGVASMVLWCAVVQASESGVVLVVWIYCLVQRCACGTGISGGSGGGGGSGSGGGIF